MTYPELNDKNDKLKTPACSDICLGHKDIESSLLQLYQAGRLPHAIVFAGPEGIGKATFAYRFIRFLLNRKHDHEKENQDMDSLFGELPDETDSDASPGTMEISPESDVFARVCSGGHPDLRVVERRCDEKSGRIKQTHDLKEIRSIASFLRMTPAEGGWRVALVDDAEALNLYAQNALLKILEEPPEQAILILVTRSAGALIPTIRSRARVIEFTPLSDDDMGFLLENLDPDIPHSDKNLLASLSAGQMGLAMKYYEQGGLDIYTKLMQILQDWPKLNWQLIHKLGDESAQKSKTEFYACFREVTLCVFHALCRAKANREPSPKLGSCDLPCTALYEETDLNTLIKAHDRLDGLYREAQKANLDPKNVILTSFIKILDSHHSKAA